MFRRSLIPPARRAGVVFATAVAATAAACAPSAARDGAAARTAMSGQQLAAQYCQSCHVLPSPALLDTATWDQWVLPRMARRLGVLGVGDPSHLEAIEGGIGGALVRAAHVYSDSALLSREEWDRLAAYYLKAAPAALPAPAVPPVAVGLPEFRVRAAPFRIASPMVTLVHVDAAGRRIYVGDAGMGPGQLAVLDGAGRQLQSVPLPSPVSSLHVAGDTLGLLFMGRLDPSDAPRGSLALLPSAAWRAGARPRPAWEVDTLQRPVFASYADLNGDGVEDVVVSEFGNQTGRLAWYERLPNGGSRRHVLSPKPGALTTDVRDWDGDGRPDILVLTGQAEEGVSLFHNQGGGRFTREWLLRLPPSYGSSALEVADVDGDGHPDLVYTNGDNGDYPSPPKPYHGVHVFLNDGRNHFAEKYFFPMPGAYKAVARDFDGDGRVDIAAIAFYPDYGSRSPLPFVYLRGLGGLRFEPRTFPDANRARWLTMDVGDVNGDGRDDLVLGSFAGMGAQNDRYNVAARWQRPDAPTVLILENTTRRAGG